MEWLIGILVLSNKNSLWSVLLLSLVSLTITLSWIISGYTYLGIILTLVYAGAIVILIVYVLYILDINKLDIIEVKHNKWIYIVLLLIGLLWYNEVLSSPLSTSSLSDIELLGILNININGVVLLISSILLLLCLTGTIYLLL